jgi:hypothetical protein
MNMQVVVRPVFGVGLPQPQVPRRAEEVYSEVHLTASCQEYGIPPRELCETGPGLSEVQIRGSNGVDAPRLRGVAGDRTLFPSGRMDILELAPPVVSVERGGTTGSRLASR